jgi:hypothetical protein
LYGAETWTPQKVDQKYLESFEILYGRKIEKIRCMDCVENEELLGKSLHTTEIRNAN